MLFDLFSKKKPESTEELEMSEDFDLSDVSSAGSVEPRISPEMQEKLDRLKKIQSVVSDFETSISQAKTTSTRSETSLASVHELLKTAEQDINRNALLVDENETLRLQLQMRSKELDATLHELDNKASLVESLKQRSQETREALQQAHVDLSQNLKRIELLNTQSDDLRSRMNEQSFELANLHERHQALEKESEQLRDLAQENSELISQKTHLISEYEREVEEAKRLQEIDNNRREQLTISVEELKGKLRELSREKIDLDTRLELSTNDLNARSKHFKEQMRAKDDRIYALESKTEALEAQSRVNEQTVVQLKEENRDLHKSLVNEDDRQRSLKDQMEQMKTSHNADREKLFASVNRISELEIRMTSLIDDKEQVARENVEFMQMVDRLTSENKQLSERLIALSSIEDKYNKLLLDHDKPVSEEKEDNKVVNLKSGKKKSA